MKTQDQTPDDVREVADLLAALGDGERRAGERVAHRVALRTAPNLRSAEAGQPARRRFSLLWLAGPALAAAVLLAALLVVSGPTERAAPLGGVEMLAADLESEIDTILAVEALWDDQFETELSAVSLEAAGLASGDGAITDNGSEL